MKSEWLQARPNQDKITDLHRDVTNLRNQMQEKMASHRRNVHEVLTPDQRAHIENDGAVRGFPKQGGFQKKERRWREEMN